MKRIRWAVCLGALLINTALNAAEIRGRVYDANNAIYISGARVIIEETGEQLSSERNGRFVVSGLEPGTYTLSATAVGYSRVQQVVVVSDVDGSVEVELRFGGARAEAEDEEIYELEAFTVTGSLVGAAKALNQQRAADNLQSVVSSDAFGQFVDRNAAEALQRMPGVTVEDSQGEGKYLIIRGANPAWSAVSIDGVELATPDENGRTIGLNIITVDQLESIEVSKSWMPYQKGGSVGGSVNLKTRSALDRGEMFASIEGGYGKYDISDEESWRGSVTFGDVFDIGKRAIGFQVSVNQSEDNRGSDTLTMGWRTSSDIPLGGDVPSGFLIDQTDFDYFRILRERIGVSGKLEFLIAPGHELYASASYNRFDDLETLHSARLSTSFNSVDYGGSQILTPQLATRLGYDLNDPAVQARINAQTSNSISKIRFEEAIALGELVFNPETETFEYSSVWAGSSSRRLTQTETVDQITTYQVGGVHNFTPEIKLEWKGFSSAADQVEEVWWLNLPSEPMQVIPDTRGRIEEYQLLSSPESSYFEADRFRLTRTAGSYSHNFDFSTDERIGGDLDLTWIKDVGRFRMTTRAGGAYDAREKSYQRDHETYSGVKTVDPVRFPSNQIPMSVDFLYGGMIDEFLYDYGDYQYGPIFDKDKVLTFLKDEDRTENYGYTFTRGESDITSNITQILLRNYVASEDITGAYLQETIEWNNWQLTFGFRWEKVENTFTNLAITTRIMVDGKEVFLNPLSWRIRPLEHFARTAISEREYDHWLPAIHLKKTFKNDLILRASVTKTLARPLFTDLIPQEIPGLSGSAFAASLQLPNLNLMPMESINYDLSIQKYFEKVGYINLSAFYKQLDGVIYEESWREGPNDFTAPYEEKYNSRRSGANPPPLSWEWAFSRKINSGEGKLYGIEFAYDRDLDFLGSWARGFGFNFNVAVMESEVALVTLDREEEKVPLFKQPDKTANLSLYYENKHLFVRLSYNLRGEYLNGVAGGNAIDDLVNNLNVGTNALDRYVDEYSRLDLNVRWKVNPNFQVFAEITNITNEPIKHYEGNRSRPILVQYTGPIFFIGAKWNL